MFGFFLNMINLQRKNNISFGGISAWTNITQFDGTSQQYTHQSSFMRDFPVVDYATGYIKETFPKGSHIADYACSYGQETYTIAMLLDDANKNKKYEITGIDISPIAIAAAKRGVFVVEPSANESVLFSKKQLHFQPSKHYFIDETGQKIFYESKPNHPNYPKSQAGKIRDLFASWFIELDADKKLKEEIIKGLFEYNKPLAGSKILLAIPEKSKGVLDFICGDIMKIGRTLVPKKTGAVFFQNAPYHITGCMGSGSVKGDIPPLKRIFGQINDVISDKGIYVLGRLTRDHLLGFNENRTHTVVQNNKKIKVFDSSPVHDALRAKNFEPIFYALDSAFGQVNLPAVWRKRLKK